MKIDYKDDKITMFINKKLIKFNIEKKEEIEDYIKQLVLVLRKRNLKISGFYKVKVYSNKNYGLIIEMRHEDELDFFPDLIDLKLVIFYNSKMYLKTDDYFIIENLKTKFRIDNNWYIDIDDISDKELNSLVEFTKLIYGEKAQELLAQLKKVC